MPFLNGKINLQFYTDALQTEFPLENIPNLEKEFADDSVTGIQPLVFSLAATASQAINLNGLTVKRVYIASNISDLLVNFNGLGNIAYEALIPGFMPLAVTSLTITNASATVDTTVTVILITA